MYDGTPDIRFLTNDMLGTASPKKNAVKCKANFGALITIC